MSRQSHDPVTDQLLVRFLSGEADDAQRAKVTHWLGASEANSHYFETLKWAFSSSRPQVDTRHINEEAEWQAFKSNVQTRPRTIMLRRFGIAASLILLVGLSLFYLSTRLANSRSIKLVSGREVITQTLPDGSGITLNKRSALYYNRSYNIRNRDVRLTGEAFFAIATDHRLPFVIHIRNIQVEVLGTSFNVRDAVDKTEIIVETGEVRVKKDSLVIHLHAGEKLTLPHDGLSSMKRTNTDPFYSYYRTKKFICNGTPLRDLITALNTAYDQHITLADQRDGDLPITVTFTDNSATDILTVICSTLQLTTVRRDDTITLKKRNSSLQQSR